MTKLRLRLAVGVLIASALTLAYRLGRVQADGIPAVQPLTYSGVLEEAGSPVTGDRFIFVNLWKDAASTTASDRVCQTTSTVKTRVTSGWFTVDLDAACTAAVNANPDLWVELIVESETLPRTKLKAVPYALQAGTAQKTPWSGITGAPADVLSFKTLSATINTDGTIARQDGAWVASAGSNGVEWTVTFAAGTFSGPPSCVCGGGFAQISPIGMYYACSVLTATATQAVLATFAVRTSTGSTPYLAGANYGPFTFQCTGPR
jgi:hypothetical protein